MKLACVAVLLVAYLVVPSDANSLFSGGKMQEGMAKMAGFGINLPPECKQLAEKRSEEIALALWDNWLKPKCKAAKCKPTYNELKQYWKQIQKTTEMIVAKIKTLSSNPSFDFSNLPSQCSGIKSFADWGEIWKLSQKLADICIFKPGPSHDEVVNMKDYCNANEKELQKTADCFKTNVMGQIPNYMHLAPAAIPCAQYSLKTWCNNKHAAVWVDFNTKTAFKDRKIYGKFNPYQALEDYLTKHNCKAHPVIKNDPGMTD